MNVHYIIAKIAFILVIFGALNWGMIGAFGIDVITRVLGSGSQATRVLCILIGISALILLFL